MYILQNQEPSSINLDVTILKIANYRFLWKKPLIEDIRPLAFVSHPNKSLGFFLGIE